MFKKSPVYIICFIAVFALGISAKAQVPDDEENQQTGYPNSSTRMDSRGNPIRKQDSADLKLKHRDPLEDSITISYHFFDSTKTYKLDSTINDFYRRFPVPWNNTNLGNFGNATRSLLFAPYMKPGWDAGFHAYDRYKYTIEGTRLFTTTRPYTELSYLLGSGAEQLINVMHTQNRNDKINLGFEYRLIASPGLFKNQYTSHNNVRINLAYVSNNKRYGNYLIYINNKIRSSENGGIQSDDGLAGAAFNAPFNIPTRLGDNASYSRNPAATINTGSAYNESVVLFRQNYDLGQKDSLVTDSTVYKLFYPRIRFQHTIEYHKENYVYLDYNAVDSSYNLYYNLLLAKDSVYFRDAWQNLTNDFSIISFPQKNNLNQFLKLGAGYEMISGGFYPYKKKYSNVYFAGEYRNRTRNQKWDVAASAKFYGAGSYAGDYEAHIILERLLSNKIGALRFGFDNVNRSPSEIFTKGISSFPVTTEGTFNKQNISRAYAVISLPAIGLTLKGDYYVAGNYIYFDDFFSAKQESAIFNVLHIAAEKKIKLTKHWNWYIDAHVQQATGNAPVNMPLYLTRNRFAYEGNFYKNLFLSTGFEVMYNDPYHADNYSPLNGQFFLQDTFSTRANRPDINFFLNFRIKSFKGFLRFENLNTLNPNDKYRFTKNNFIAPHYPQRALWFRFGIWWNFVN